MDRQIGASSIGYPFLGNLAPCCPFKKDLKVKSIFSATFYF